MSYEYRLTRKKFFILCVTIVALGILLFIFGLIWGKLFPLNCPSSRRPENFIPRPKEKILQQNTVQNLKNQVLKSKTDELVEKLLKLYFSSDSNEDKEDENQEISYFTILHNGFWKTNLDSVLRLVPEKSFHKDIPFFSLTAGAFISREKAHAFISSVGKSYNPFIIKAYDKKENPWYLVIIDDFDNLEETRKAAENFIHKEGIPAIIAFVDEYSQSPLRRYEIDRQKCIPQKEEPEPPQKEEVKNMPPGPYAIRLSCYNTKETALRAVSIYKERGLETYILEPGKKRGYCRWIVCMGHYKDIDVAKNAKKELTIKDAFIIKAE